PPGRDWTQIRLREGGTAMTWKRARPPHALGLLTACALAVGALLAGAGAPTALASNGDGGAHRWVGTWASSPQLPAGVGQAGLADQTERAVVHVSVGGEQVRVRLSNAFGSGPVTLDEVDVAVRAAGAAVVPGTVRRLRFDHRASVTIAAGREGLSDPGGPRARPAEGLAVGVAATGSTWPGPA